MEFQISAKAKKVLFGIAGLGLVLFLVGVFTDHTEYAKTRILSNFLIDGLFFLFISLGALFFLALQYATETGWSVAVKRVIEGVASYVLVGVSVVGIIRAAMAVKSSASSAPSTLKRDVSCFAVQADPVMAMSPGPSKRR